MAEEMTLEKQLAVTQDSLGRSDSLQAVLRWHEQGQKRLSIGLELECYLPDLGLGGSCFFGG